MILEKNLLHFERKGVEELTMVEQRYAKLIKRTSGLSKGSLLDIGTGTGYFSNAMKERGWRVRAISLWR